LSSFPDKLKKRQTELEGILAERKKLEEEADARRTQSIGDDEEEGKGGDGEGEGEDSSDNGKATE